MRLLLLVMLVGFTFSEEQPAERQRQVDAELAENTRQLHAAFSARDAAREASLYTQRRDILVRRRDLRPPSGRPAKVHRGFIESFPAARVSLRYAENVSTSLWVGTVFKRDVREAYAALQVGDEVELTFTEEPHPWSDTAYSDELTGVRQLGPGKAMVETMGLSSFPRITGSIEASILRVAGRRPDGTTTYLALIRNLSREPLRMDEGDGVKVRITNHNDTERKIAASISPARTLPPGEVLTLQIEVAPLPQRATYIGITVTSPDHGVLVGAAFPVVRDLD